MSHSKIANLALYIVLGITIPLLILFYFGTSLVNTEQYQAKVQKIENPAPSTGVNVAMDLQSADSLATAGDTTAVQQVQAPVQTGSATKEEVKLTSWERLVYYRMDISLVWGYILLIISGLTAVIFPMVYAIVHPANLIRSLLVLVAVGVLIFASYLLSSGETMEIIGYTGTDNSNPAILKLIDTGLIFSYFMLGVALLAILYAEVSNYFK